MITMETQSAFLPRLFHSTTLKYVHSAIYGYQPGKVQLEKGFKLPKGEVPHIICESARATFLISTHFE
jgi:hypothetical protein